MASYESEGLELSDSWEYAQRSSFLGSGPVQAEVGRRYRIGDQEQAEHLLNEAVAFAEFEGWSMTRPIADLPHFFGGARELGPGTGELSVFLVAKDPINDPDGPSQLGIKIEFDPAPEE